MNQGSRSFRLYGSVPNIVVSGLAAATFTVRAVMSAAGIASLSGPAWTIFDALLAAGFLIRCFDRIVVTAQGVTAYRVGFPRRMPAEGLHQFQVVDKSARWSGLYAQTVDGKQIPIAYARRTPDGQTRMRQLWDHVQMFLGPQLLPLTTEGAAAEKAALAEAAGVLVPDGAKRRCVHAGCPAHFVEVTGLKCESCGSETQRISA